MLMPSSHGLCTVKPCEWCLSKLASLGMWSGPLSLALLIPQLQMPEPTQRGLDAADSRFIYLKLIGGTFFPR
jgi:hypothetical protein